jgi:hypothetical protein
MATNPHATRYRTVALAVSLAAHAAFFGLLFLLPEGSAPARVEVVSTEVTEEGIVAVRLDLLPSPARPPRQAPGIDPDTEVRITEPHADPSVYVPAFPNDAATGGAGGKDPAPPSASRGAAPALMVPPTARSIVFLLDRSASMGLHGAWAVARRETLAALRTLPAGTRFQVIPYNRQAEPLPLAGTWGLVASAPEVVADVERELAGLSPSGGTDHVRALRRGLLLQPDALVLITDAGDMTAADVAAVTASNRSHTAIHTVEVTVRTHEQPGNPLARLAADNGGTYRRLSPEGGLAAVP